MPKNRDRDVKFIELFCGIGGFRLGLEKSNRKQQEDAEVRGCGDSISYQGEQPKQPKKWRNYACVWANDIDKYACQIYRKHWGDVHEGDIRTVDTDAIPDHDLLCAGFPCQSFSIAGKRGGFEDTRGTLFFEICRVLRAKRPGYVFLENVKGLLSHDDGATFGTILGALDELGYDCQWQVLNSKNWVPQNRERVFIIGHLRGQSRPKVFPLGETDEISNGWDAKEQIATILQYPGHSGGNYRGMTMVITRTRSDQEYSDAEVVPPLRQSDKAEARVVVPTGIRRLAPTECERLQGFPDGWTAKGIDTNGNEVSISDTQRYKCLGNAVTVNVIEAIGRTLQVGF